MGIRFTFLLAINQTLMDGPISMAISNTSRAELNVDPRTTRN